jgi:hypothetical protein
LKLGHCGSLSSCRPSYSMRACPWPSVADWKTNGCVCILSQTCRYSPLQPGFPQGKLEMWLDIFPKVDGDQSVVPEAIDISPRIPDPMVLRVVIQNCDDVVLDEANIAGERMSDIYIKSFFRGMEVCSWNMPHRPSPQLFASNRHCSLLGQTTQDGRSLSLTQRRRQL